MSLFEDPKLEYYRKYQTHARRSPGSFHRPPGAHGQDSTPYRSHHNLPTWIRPLPRESPGRRSHAQPGGRAAYVPKNIADYYKADSTEYTKAIVLLETSEEHPLRISEFKPLQASLGLITSQCDHTCYLFGKNPDLGHDLHILIVLSR